MIHYVRIIKTSTLWLTMNHQLVSHEFTLLFAEVIIPFLTSNIGLLSLPQSISFKLCFSWIKIPDT